MSSTYYQTNKNLWKTKYNKTEYCKTKGKRFRKKMIVINVPDTDIQLKFKSITDLIKYADKVDFDFERDFFEFIIPQS